MISEALLPLTSTCYLSHRRPVMYVNFALFQKTTIEALLDKELPLRSVKKVKLNASSILCINRKNSLVQKISKESQIILAMHQSRRLNVTNNIPTVDKIIWKHCDVKLINTV